jgi:hypothetical protein
MVTTNEMLVVTVSEDHYQAHMLVKGNTPKEELTVETIRGALKEAGVSMGISDTVVLAFTSRPVFDKPVLIAQGIKGVDGKDGFVEYLFDTEKARPIEDASGKVNIHELHFIHNVLKEQKIVVIHPPEPGTAGYKVTGEKFTPKQAKKAGFIAGSGTRMDPDDPSVLLASTDGHVMKHKDGSVEVQSKMIIRGDVDFSVGNIDYVGSMTIMGDIKGEFVVKVKGNLEVHGNVGEATVDVGGDVIVRKGFAGYGSGKIIAGGNVKVHNVMNQTVIAGKDIIIEKECLNAKLDAHGKVDARGAIIVGGSIDALEGVDVNELGHAEGSKVLVRIGKRGKFLERLGELEKELKQDEKQFAEMKEGIYKLTMMQMNGSDWNEQKQELLLKLQAIQKVLPRKIEGLVAERDKLNEGLHDEKDASISVRGTIHTNVVVDINGAKKMIENEISEVKIVKVSGLIEIRPL